MLGRFEEAVLMALLYIKRPATVADICEALADHKMPRSLGWVYTALDRMIRKKLVTRRKGEAAPKRGGKSRYLYNITSGGRVAVNEAQKARALWRRAAKGR
jgi:PadR family transcriptional regulator, regulatory protein PadR